MISVGIFTGYYPYTLAETIERAKKDGMSCVQLDLEFKDIDLSRGNITKEKANQVRDAFRDANLPIVAISAYTNLVHPDPEKRQENIDYVKEILNPLLIYDKKNNQNLIDTLREYLKCGQNVSQASQNLYIHRNTMIKRVEKIEELLGCSIKNAEVTNQLYNAVKIYDLFLKK